MRSWRGRATSSGKRSSTWTSSRPRTRPGSTRRRRLPASWPSPSTSPGRASWRYARRARGDSGGTRRAPAGAAPGARPVAGDRLGRRRHPGGRGLRPGRSGPSARAGSALWLSFLIAALAAGLTAYSYGRLAQRRPKDSPEFQYTTLAFGPRVGFVAGWLMLVADLLAAAAVAIGFGGYLAHLAGTPVA